MVKAEKGVGGCACNGISLKLGTQAKLRVWFEAADACSIKVGPEESYCDIR